MIRKSLAAPIRAGSVALALFALLSASSAWESSPGFIGSALKGVITVFQDPETQWMVFVCLGVYFTTFLFLRFRAVPDFWKNTLWLIYVLLISAVLYTVDYTSSTQALTLLGGAVLGQGVAAWAGFELSSRQPAASSQLAVLLMFILVILLAFASVGNVDSSHSFAYRSHSRWSGPWDNPNLAGLLMGTGVVLGLGLASGIWPGRNEKIKKKIFALLCFMAAMLIGGGLLHSFSRGAWLGTVCGLAYLIVQGFSVAGSEFIRQVRENVISLAIIVLAVSILALWQFKPLEGITAQRAFSVANQNDFSSHNRVAAWEGGLQMMAEKPWFGFGWNRPEPLYENYYLPPKLNESAAIEMNDYLMFGATLGIPALFCFVMYLWRLLTRKSEINEADWPGTVCHAGAIVLLVGFWFDGGLFKLPAAAMFWILLESGSATVGKTTLATDRRR